MVKCGEIQTLITAPGGLFQKTISWTPGAAPEN